MRGGVRRGGEGKGGLRGEGRRGEGRGGEIALHRRIKVRIKCSRLD